MFFETPAAWRAICEQYQLYKFDPGKQVLLLAKKPGATISPIKAISVFACKNKQWQLVPVYDQMLYCSFNFKLNYLGWLCKLFYKIPAIFLNLRYANGQIQSFKLMPAISQVEFWLTISQKICPL